MSCYMRETYEKEYERLPRFRDKDGFIQFRNDYVLYVERENKRLLNEIEKLGIIIAKLTDHQTKECDNYCVVQICDTCRYQEFRVDSLIYDPCDIFWFCTLHKKEVGNGDACSDWELRKQKTTFSKSIGSEEVIL
jgi:hypothetical protein